MLFFWGEPVSEQEATAEIERYMAIPGQALSAPEQKMARWAAFQK
jgi:hypothetical protein